MRWTWTISLAALALILAAIWEGNFMMMALAVFMAPIYAWLLASGFLIVFILLASVFLTVGRAIVDRQRPESFQFPVGRDDAPHKEEAA